MRAQHGICKSGVQVTHPACCARGPVSLLGQRASCAVACCCCCMRRRWNVQHFKLVEQQQQGRSTQLATSALQKQVKFHAGRERRQRLRWQKQLTRQALAQQQGRVSVRKLTPQQQLVVGIHQYSASWTGWDQSHKLLQQQRMRAEVRLTLARLQGLLWLLHAPCFQTGWSLGG